MRIFPLSLLLLAACDSPTEVDPPAASEEMEIEVEQVGPDPDVVQLAMDGLIDRPELKTVLGEHASGLLSFKLDRIDDGDPTSNFTAIVYDYVDNIAHEIHGDVEDNVGALTLLPGTAPQHPTAEELKAAAEIALAQDVDLADRYLDGSMEFFAPMPGLGRNDDGDRIVHLGIREVFDDTETEREIGAANLSKGTLLRYDDGAPQGVQLSGFTCNPPPTVWGGGSAGAPSSARVVARIAGQEIWSATIVRARGSSGPNGSGVELLDVRYRGEPMLASANLPILNVLYEPGGCGAFLDWQNAENSFQVGPVIREVTNGINVVQWSKTIRELDDDGGDYKGVAIFLDAIHNELVVLSELEAGWYRYISEWRFSPQGALDARFGFSAVQNYCTCRPHTHHSYWRFDPALGTSDNTVEVYDDNTGWVSVDDEAEFHRDEALNREWRVTDPVSGRAIRVTPGGGEDEADDFGIADLWVVADDPDEKFGPWTGLEARHDEYVDGESVDTTDVALWTAGHFLHDDADPTANQTHTVRWTFTAENW